MQRFRPKQHCRNGFSLIELSVVIAIVSIVAVLGLESMAMFMNRTAYRVTQERMAVIKEAIAKHRYVYGYLPCPALSTIGPTNNTYGKENRAASCGGQTLIAGVYWGDVPVRDLNLPISYLKDAYGTRFRYAVTNTLAQAGTAANKFGNSGSVGLIKIRTGMLDPAQSQQIATAAYVVLSFGADKRGSMTTNCVTSTANDGMIDSANCRFSSGDILKIGTPAGAGTTIALGTEVFYDSRYNNGSNEEMHFDDLILWQTKSQL